MPNGLTKQFKREIVFTKLPLSGALRYRDVFQMFPADLKGMPTTKTAHKHHPQILEYWYTNDELEQIKVEELYSGLEDLHRLTSLSYHKNDLYLGLLTLITTNRFFTYQPNDSRWGWPLLDENAGSEMNKWSSKWCFEWFMWPELPEQLKIDRFTDLASVHPRVLPWDYYYTHPDFDENLESQIKFSNITLQFFDSYFEMDESTRKVLDSAISSANAAMEFIHTRKKLALLSAFTAIETMVNFDTKDFEPSKCDKCGQDVYKISARYRNFLLKYIGDSPANKKKFNRYYKLRSTIVHTGQDFKTEKLFAEVDEETKFQERLQIAEVVMMSKLAIIFWTIKNRKAKETVTN